MRDHDLSAQILNERQNLTRNNTNHHNHYDYHHRSHNDVIRCPHHVPLTDGEWGPDRDIQIRAPYQVCL